jgi:hypothetical protein
MTRILLNSKEYDLEDIQENPSLYVPALERAKIAPGFANCLCCAARPKLVVRRLGSGFILARWPLTGTEHDKETCTFYDDERRLLPGAGSANEAFIPGPTGLNAKLDVSVTVRTAGPRPAAGGSVSTGAGAGRRTAGLLAFLEYLWEGANLHKWYGDRYRSWSTCFSRLSEQVDGGMINSQPMSEILHVMEPFAEDRKGEIDARFQTFLDGIVRGPDHSRRGFLLCEIKEWRSSKFGYQVFIRQSHLARIFISKNLHDASAKSFAGAWTCVGAPDRRNVALLVLERNSAGTLNVVDMAAMLLSKAYLPCDSSYEVELAERLVAEARRFTKPLRHVGATEVHPDFVLNDTHPETVIEVYGMTGNAKYDARKLEKQAHYAAHSVRCVEWVPATTPLSSLALPRAG